jgi:uncharacterized protein
VRHPLHGPWHFFHRRLAAVMRWLHIYVSMASLLIVLFFSVTGITLNHPDWTFGNVRKQEEFKGQVPPDWLKPGRTEAQVLKFEIAEALRRAHHLRGTVEEFRVDDAECVVSFKAPGSSADAFLDRKTGRYTITVSYDGLVAVLNDLHKGRHSGPVWSWVIDLTAALMVFISMSGMILLLYFKRRRRAGLVLAVLGALLALFLAWRMAP